MQQFARGMGFLFLASGGLLLAFPKATRQLMQVRAEYLQLSSDALRLLGISYALTGALLVAATTQPEEVARMAGGVTSELRKAA